MLFLLSLLTACTVTFPEHDVSLSVEAPSEAAPTPPPAAAAPTSSDPLLRRLASKPLDITRHGACRMDCRGIDRSEIDHVLAHGALNPSRSRDDGACPSHAIEGTVPSGERVRLVFADCERNTKLVTAIDLDNDWPCDCP